MQSTTLLSISLVVFMAIVAVGGHASSYDVVVETAAGFIGGAQTPLGYQFRSVPFAAPPVGQLRFAPPQEVEPWEGVRNTTGIPFACPQPSKSNGEWDEDCLYTSIYVPLSFKNDKRAKRDVVVFWHGGAFRGGGQVNFIGDYLANHTNTVIVVPQYRLGVLGLLGNEAFFKESSTYGNYNLQDQHMLLLWVRENIRNFGGNPHSVTITGQSAGAISVAIHAVAPMSRGLYHKAIGHSGVGYSGKLLEPKSWITNTMQKVVDALGCATNDTSPAGLEAIRQCVRAAPVASIMSIQTSLPELAKPRPAVDGVVIPSQPIDRVRQGLIYRVPTMLGLMSNESTVLIQKSFPPATSNNKAGFDAYVTSMFGANAINTLAQLYPVGSGPNAYPTYYSAMAKIDTDWYYTCPVIQWLEALADSGHKDAYLFHWTYEASWFPSYYGAHHNEDVVYLTQQGCVLNSPTPYCEVFTPQTTPGEMPLVTFLQSFWSSFADKGDPKVHKWKPYTKTNGNQGRSYLRIETPTSSRIDNTPLQTAQCAYFNSIA